jgi:quinol monooxygenase YgiN
VSFRYQNMAALEAHQASEHFTRALKEGMEGKLAAHPSIHVVQPCGGFTRQ